MTSGTAPVNPREPAEDWRISLPGPDLPVVGPRRADRPWLPVAYPSPRSLESDQLQCRHDQAPDDEDQAGTTIRRADNDAY